jgi:hypothetical protein
VICLDVNLLLYATNPAEPRHERARTWFEDQMNSGERVGLPWHTLLGFVRVGTSRARRPSFAMNEALEYVEGWLEWDSVWIPEPTPRHREVISDLLRQVPRSRLVPDAHLAALAIEHGLTLCSADADFRVFPGLRFHNPLE